MSQRSIFIALCLGAILISSNIVGNPFVTESVRGQNSVTSVQSQSAKAKTSRAAAVLIVKSFIQRVEAFQTFQIKAVSMARLAELIWTDDKEYARSVFLKALDTCITAESGDQSQLKKARQARREVVSLIQRVDPELAKKYQLKDEEVNARQSSNSTVAAAIDLVNSNTDKSMELARESLRSDLSPGFVYYLRELQRKNAAAANQLFLDALNKVANSSLIDGDQFMLLGTYLFTGNFEPSDDIHQMSKIGIGGVLVYDISRDRVGTPPSLIQAYLRVATTLMSAVAASNKLEQKQVYYVAGYFLNRRVDQFTPELSSIFRSTMARLTDQVPPEISDAKSYERVSGGKPKTLDEQLVDTERITGVDNRDGKYLTLALGMWNQRRYSELRRILDRISDDDARAKLEIVVKYGEAAEAMNVRFAEVPSTAAKMKPGVESALVWLAVARKATESQSAIAAIDEALRAAGKVEDVRKAYILLAAAGELSRVNSSQATEVVLNAVSNLNTAETSIKPKWEREISVGKVTVRFALDRLPVPRGLNDALPGLARMNPEEAARIALGLRHESEAASAMTLISSTLLN